MQNLKTLEKKNEWVIIAGGASIQSSEVDLVKQWKEEDPDNRGVIAVTKSFYLAPWADIIHARDKRFWDHFLAEVESLSPDSIKTSYQTASGVSRIDVGLNGSNSGFQSVMIAVHLLNASHVYLLGFDMQNTGNKTHWHNGYPDGLKNYFSSFGRLGSFYNKWVAEFYNTDWRDANVINCSLESNLELFPKMTLKEALL